MNTRQFKIGNVKIGGGSPVTIQSMTNTDTRDGVATSEQILALEKAGCQIVRFSVYDEDCAKAIPLIKSRTHIPLVADIHFDYRLAIAAIENGIDKVRINPGNIGSEAKVRELVAVAKANSIPIRIGVNGGSLEKEILRRYGVTAEGMVESALSLGGWKIAHFPSLRSFSLRPISVPGIHSRDGTYGERCSLPGLKNQKKKLRIHEL